MAKALSSWEKSRRLREKKDERDRAAASRDRERRSARQAREAEAEKAARNRERERERAAEARDRERREVERERERAADAKDRERREVERERERAAEARKRERREVEREKAAAIQERERQAEAKESARRAEIRAWENEVRARQTYLDWLKGQHAEAFDIATLKADYDDRLRPRLRYTVAFESLAFAETFEGNAFKGKVWTDFVPPPPPPPTSFEADAPPVVAAFVEPPARSPAAGNLLLTVIGALAISYAFHHWTRALGARFALAILFASSAAQYAVARRARRRSDDDRSTQHAAWEAKVAQVAAAYRASIESRREEHEREQQDVLSRYERRVESDRAENDAKRSAHDASEASRKLAHYRSEHSRRASIDLRCASHGAREVTRKGLYDAYEAFLDRTWEVRDRHRRETLAAAAAGDPVAIDVLCEALLPLGGVPAFEGDGEGDASDYGVAYRACDGHRVQLKIRLPSRDIVPTRSAAMNSGGDRIVYKKVPVGEQRSCYDAFVASFSLRHAIVLFSACPTLEEVYVESYETRADPVTGHDRESILLKVGYSRTAIEGLRLKQLDALGSLSNFSHERHSISATKISMIASALDPEMLVWATHSDDGVDVPPGLLQGSSDASAANPFARATESVAIADGAPRFVDPSVLGGFRSIRDAVAGAPAGTRIHVAPGVYSEPLILENSVEIVGPNAGGEAVIEVPSGMSVIVRDALVRLDRVCLRAAGGGESAAALVRVTSGALALNGCAIGPGGGDGIELPDGDATLVLSSCAIGAIGRDAIVADGPSSVDVFDSEIGGCGGAGIGAQRGAWIRVRSSKISNNTEGIRAADLALIAIEDSDLSGNALVAWTVERATVERRGVVVVDPVEG